MTNFSYLSGAYDSETDSQGPFRWLSNNVVLEGAGSGLLLLQGSSPLTGSVTIHISQSQYQLDIPPGAPTVLPIPIEPDEEASERRQTIKLQFSTALNAPNDSRTLCFQARSLTFKETVTNQAIHCIPLNNRRGLIKGNTSLTFANGWLRMTVSKAQNTLKLSGILVPPIHQAEPALLTANGKPIKEITYRLFNHDYDFLGNVAFEGELDLANYRDSRSIRFGSVFQKDLTAATPSHQDWNYPLAATSLPLPDRSNMQRIGASDLEWFLFSGSSFVEKLEDILHQFISSDLSPEPSSDLSLESLSILDWGCGCGRLTRHLIDKKYGNVCGIDIDPLNIDWCQKHLPGAAFHLVRPSIPTQLTSEQFNVIIGHSVFTHLTEVDQYLWLIELNRLLVKGGIAVVTVMANFSTAIEPFSSNDFYHLMKQGFLDVGWQADGVDSQKPGYYRRIFHTIDYIRSYWTNFFEVVSVLEGFSDHQAAVVIRKRA
ncbi:MAG: class I SAM-dependent methyltransferase [Cyanobacteria bacterium J06621_11]